MLQLTSPRPSFVTTALLFLGAIALTPGCSSQQEVVETPPAAQPEATGPGPSTDDIKTAVRQSNDALTECYIAGTFKDAQLAGTVNVNFIIETDGHVSAASDAGSDMPDPEVVDCVLAVFSELHFEPGGGSATDVTYPVTFGQHG